MLSLNMHGEVRQHIDDHCLVKPSSGPNPAIHQGEERPIPGKRIIGSWRCGVISRFTQAGIGNEPISVGFGPKANIRTQYKFDSLHLFQISGWEMIPRSGRVRLYFVSARLDPPVGRRHWKLIVKRRSSPTNSPMELSVIATMEQAPIVLDQIILWPLVQDAPAKDQVTEYRYTTNSDVVPS